ncbi:MAG: class I SAM-dependent methyltransferase [Bacteroidota bacterium]|nr:class I SAM-dependent methyltransferase [Bacteroidota bacterium]
MKNLFQQHWDSIYATKNAEQVSWTQYKPATSLQFIHSFNVNKQAKIIDIGGGDSRLVDYLIDEGFENLTVLDISSTALEKAKQRLGEKADKVHWIVSDVKEFKPEDSFDIWHDRAAFHFLTTSEEIEQYLSVASKAVKGYLTIGTFSDNGPDKCSGLPVKQYSEKALTQELEKAFAKIRCITEDHVTPFHTIQNFLFCSFKKVEVA